MNAIPTIKLITNFVVGAGTAKIVRDVIDNNVEPETKTEKVTVAAGSIAIGGVVADKTSEWTDARIDEAVEHIEKIRTMIQNRNK